MRGWRARTASYSAASRRLQSAGNAPSGAVSRRRPSQTCPSLRACELWAPAADTRLLFARRTALVTSDELLDRDVRRLVREARTGDGLAEQPERVGEARNVGIGAAHDDTAVSEVRRRREGGDRRQTRLRAKSLEDVVDLIIVNLDGGIGSTAECIDFQNESHTPTVPTRANGSRGADLSGPPAALRS